jgi:chromosome segregation ATPase
MVAEHEHVSETNETEGGLDMSIEEIQAQLDEALSKLTALEEEHGEVTGERDQLMADISALQGSLDEAKDKITSLEEKLDSLKQENTELVEANRRMELAEVMTDEEFAEQRDVVMAMSDDAVALLASKAAPQPADPPPAQPVVNISPPDDNPDEITLE